MGISLTVLLFIFYEVPKKHDIFRLLIWPTTQYNGYSLEKNKKAWFQDLQFTTNIVVQNIKGCLDGNGLCNVIVE